MKRFLKIVPITMLLCSHLLAETRASEFSLFKRIIGPSMNWGENGLMLVPKATPIGKGNLDFGITSVDSGKIQGEKLYLTTATVMIGTSDDVEVGLSKRTFIWENGDRSDINMDSFHLKARVLNLTDYYTPKVAVGVNGVSIKNNKFDDNSNILYNPYLAITLPIRVFTDNFIISATAVAEKVYVNGESSKTFYSAGADMVFFKTLYLIAEAQGLNKKDEDPVINVGAKLKYGWFSIGAGLFNIQKDKVKSGEVGTEENKEQYWMVSVNLNIPLLKIFGLDKKEPPKKEKKEEKGLSEKDLYNSKLYQ